jgi:hypothetical protein
VELAAASVGAVGRAAPGMYWGGKDLDGEEDNAGGSTESVRTAVRAGLVAEGRLDRQHPMVVKRATRSSVCRSCVRKNFRYIYVSPFRKFSVSNPGLHLH